MESDKLTKHELEDPLCYLCPNDFVVTSGSLTQDIAGVNRSFFYHPPTNLHAGNVFSHVCLSFCLQGRGPMWSLRMIHWTSLYRDPPVQGPLASYIWWPRLETCSNLFTWGPPPLVLTFGRYWQVDSKHRKECLLSYKYFCHWILWKHFKKSRIVYYVFYLMCRGQSCGVDSDGRRFCSQLCGRNDNWSLVCCWLANWNGYLHSSSMPWNTSWIW